MGHVEFIRVYMRGNK